MTHPVEPILDLFDAKAPDVTAALKREAHLQFAKLQRPVSVNDVRRILDVMQYRGDPRILASAFPRKEWVAVGYTTTNSEKAHARTVRTFLPRHQD